MADHQPKIGEVEIGRLRESFLRAAWDGIISSSDTTWMENLLNQRAASSESILERGATGLRGLVDGGADHRQLADLVRLMQFEAVFSLLDAIDEGVESERPVGELVWALVAVANHVESLEPVVDSLHEDFLGANPESRR